MHTLVRELATAVEGGEAHATKHFWDKVREIGTPLFEKILDKPGYCTVTFVWQDEGHETRDVIVGIKTAVQAQIRKNDLSPSRMTRIADTDVWQLSLQLRADLRATYRICPLDNRVPELTIKSTDTESFQRMWAAGSIDSLNPNTFPSLEGQPPRSVIELPDAPPQPWWQLQDGPHGDVHASMMTSKVFGNERRLWTYTPPSYSTSAEPYPVMVLLDGDVWGDELPIWSTLDNLINAGQIPPMVVITVDSLDTAQRRHELGCNESFVEFILDELLPAAHQDWNVTDNPNKTIIAGQNLGGLAAAFLAFRAADRFGNVLSQSGSFWWPRDPEFMQDEESVIQEFAGADRKPLRFYLEAGLLERTVIPGNRNFRNVLEAKGYEVTYREYHGGQDYLCWRGGMADGLIALTHSWHNN